MTDATINAIHGSDSTDSAYKELEFFFPKEHTVAVIKPDAATEHKGISHFCNLSLYRGDSLTSHDQCFFGFEGQESIVSQECLYAMHVCCKYIYCAYVCFGLRCLAIPVN